MLEAPTLKLEVYEGPLDLLLSLINKNKMDIGDIAITVICDQYFEYLSQAEAMDMDLASEFIVMASELMLIKSRMLLPRTEEEEDPRAPLAEAIMMYKTAKEAAAALLPMYFAHSGRMIKDEDELLPINELPTGLDPSKLAKAFLLMMSRISETEAREETLISPIVHEKPVPVSKMAEKLIDFVKKRNSSSVVSILAVAKTKSELIAAFIAMLEMIKQKILVLCEEPSEDESGDMEYTTAFRYSENADESGIISGFGDDYSGPAEGGAADGNV